jgi:hypothetical protein
MNSPHLQLASTKPPWYRLSTLSSSALKARLDRIFTETVGSTVDNYAEPDPEAADLQKDLESLYAEIPSVAEMAAEQEFLQPVIKEVQKCRMKAEEGLRLGGAYVSLPTPNPLGLIAALTIATLDSRRTFPSSET